MSSGSGKGSVDLFVEFFLLKSNVVLPPFKNIIKTMGSGIAFYLRASIYIYFIAYVTASTASRIKVQLRQICAESCSIRRFTALLSGKPFRAA